MPEVRKQSFYIYEICDVANSDKTITKIKAKIMWENIQFMQQQ